MPQRVPDRAPSVPADASSMRALPPEAILRLQAMAGNGAVAALLQRKAEASPAPPPPQAPRPTDVTDVTDAKAGEDEVDTSEFTDDPKAAAAKLATLPPALKFTTPAPPLPGPAPGPVKAPLRPPPPKKLAPPSKKGAKGKPPPPKPAQAPGLGQIVKKPVPPPPPMYRFEPGMDVPPPAEVVGLRPADDPAFARTTAKARQTVKATKKHATGKQEGAAAQEAAEPPANDKLSQAKANRAETMGAAKPKGFDEEAFVRAVEAALAKAAPQNLEQAGELDERAAGIKETVGASVTGGKKAAAGDVETKANEPPDPSTAVEKPVTPMTPVDVAPPQPVSASAAMPAPAPTEQLDLRHGPAQVDDAMASADVTEEQLKESNEPTFGEALDAKKEGEAHAAKTPGEVRKKEAGILGTVATDSAAAETAAVTQSRANVTTGTAQVGDDKKTAKSKDEQARKEVADNVEKIFDKTKADVDGILDGLDGKVDDLFTTGEAAVREAFTKDWNKRLSDYKHRRYSGLRGKYRWVRDKFRGLPEEADNLFQLSRNLYEQQMKQLVRRIAQLVSQELTKATMRIDEGRKQVAGYVGSLKGDLAKVGQEAAAGITDKFADLDSSVKDKFDELSSGLAKKYAASREAVDEEIKAAQEANKGLIDKAIGAIKGVIDVIRQLKDMVLNVLRKIADVIGSIIAHPIRFLENFVGAVKEGVQNFSAKIEDHLQEGLMGWLLGSLAAKGVDIPKTFDIPSMFKLVLSVLGLSYAFVRERLVRQVTEAGVSALEKGSDVIKRVVGGGVGAIWEMVLDKVSGFVDMVITPIKDFIANKVVRAGIEFLVSMLNPAAAFIKACKMIYAIVMFFVERGRQIKEFIETVIDAAGDIARGGMGGVPAKIEGSLAKLLPLAISFLASLLGLGGIGDKVKSIINKVRGPITKAVDSVIGAVVKTTKFIWQPAVNAFKKGKAKVTDLYGKGKAKLEKGKEWAKGKAKAAKDKVKSLFKRQVVPMPIKGEPHSLVAEPKAKGFKLYMQSEPVLLTTVISRFIAKLEARSKDPKYEKTRAAIATQIASLRALSAQVADLEGKAEKADKVTPTGAPAGFDRAMRETAEKAKSLLYDPAGTAVDMSLLGAFGMPLGSYLQAQDVADRAEAVIDIRATNIEAPELLAKGHQPKPESFKEKTVTELDVDLGIPKEYLGRMAWFNPKPLPDAKPDTMTDKRWSDLNERAKYRREEYLSDQEDMERRLREHEFTIIRGEEGTEGGVVTLTKELKGLAYTGDHDIFDIRPAGKAPYAVNLLKAAPFRVQHGAHMTWTVLPGMLGRKGLKPRERMIYEKIVRKHGPGQGGENLLRVQPNAPPVTARAFPLPPLPAHETTKDKTELQEVFRAEPREWELNPLAEGKYTTDHDTLMHGVRAIVVPGVLRSILDPALDEGRLKAPAFHKALGFDKNDVATLAGLIMVGARTCKATAVQVGKMSARVAVVIPATGVDGKTADIRTVWFYTDGNKKPPHLVNVELA